MFVLVKDKTNPCKIGSPPFPYWSSTSSSSDRFLFSAPLLVVMHRTCVRVCVCVCMSVCVWVSVLYIFSCPGKAHQPTQFSLSFCLSFSHQSNACACVPLSVHRWRKRKRNLCVCVCATLQGSGWLACSVTKYYRWFLCETNKTAKKIARKKNETHFDNRTDVSGLICFILSSSASFPILLFNGVLPSFSLKANRWWATLTNEPMRNSLEKKERKNQKKSRSTRIE